MKFMPGKVVAFTSGISLGLAALGVQAGHGGQPELVTAGASSGAEFTGGATINGGVSYLAKVPASEPADLVVTVRPAAGDIGNEADIYVILNAPGLGFFQKSSSGSWLTLDLNDLSALQPYTSKALEENEKITVLDGLVGEDVDMAGMSLGAHVAYALGGNLATLTYNDVTTPAQLTFAESAADTCPANTFAAPSGETFQGRNVCNLSGRITDDTRLTSNFTYFLEDQVIIGENEVTANEDKVRLTIDAGTTIIAPTAGGGLAYLVIDRGGQLHANGSREKPVVFTYEDEDLADEFTRGEWGGLVLNGSAPINVGGGVAEGEGASGNYGGENPDDSSGVLTFMQVKYAGQNYTEEDELNGIAFQGTGSGTLVDYVQVHNNSDDGIEFFGGTTNARHILLSGNEDDALDWTQGWRGKLQFVAIRQGSDSEHCIEADSNSDNNDAMPRANPVISNITCAGPSDSNKNGFKLREGTSARISNAVIGNFGTGYCIDIDDNATFDSAGGSIANLNGSLTLTHSRLATGCILQDDPDDNNPFNVTDWFHAQTDSMEGDVDLGGDSGLVNGPVLNAVMPSIPDDSFFEQVDHIGAIKDEASDWTAGWSWSD